MIGVGDEASLYLETRPLKLNGLYHDLSVNSPERHKFMRDKQRGHQESHPPAAAIAPEDSAAGKPAFFLRPKLLPPRPAPTLLPRPRLVERLAANLSHPVTLVMANAGSGKTTLVAEFVRTHVSRF